MKLGDSKEALLRDEETGDELKLADEGSSTA